MKRVWSILLATLLLAGCQKPFEGHISEFRYEYGHPWVGYHVYAITTVDGQVHAKMAFEKTGPVENGMESQEVQLVLTEEERAAFDELCLKTLRLPDWKERYADNSITCQDVWSLSYTWDGVEYETSGYAVFPEGLSEMRAFFEGLDWPE